MIHPVSNAAPPAVQVQPAAPTKASVSAQSQPAAPTDSVSISNLAQAALQEALETSVQTNKEAAGGDLQAKHLLAREAAAKTQ
jgi:hypothetical protein